MMFTINQHIEYLLTRHDCVVIPGWGALIANSEPSRYDRQSHLMTRPVRSIAFNAAASHNDGLLAQSLMRREQMTYEQAMRFIADSVSAFNRQLAAGAEVSMGRLGYFRRQDGGRNEFVPLLNDRSCDGYYGLADVQVKTVETLEREMTPAVTAHSRRNLFSRKATRIAASVAVLIGLGVVLSTPVIVNRDHHAMATMTPVVTAPQSQQLHDVTVQQGVAAQTIKMVDAFPGITAAGNVTGKYYMVIATLRNQQELEAFRAKYPDLVPSMKLLDYKGMMCVYVARSDDYSLLMGLRDELPELLRDIWIYN